MATTLFLATLHSALLLTLAWALAVALRRQPGRTRYLVWSAAVVGSLSLSVLTPLATSLPARWRPALLPGTTSAAPAAPAVVLAPDFATPEQALRSPALLPAAPPAAAPRTVPWTALAVMLWLAGAAAVLARLGLGLTQIARLARRSRPLAGDDWDVLLAELRGELDIARPVRLLISEEVTTPMTGGVWRPVVFLPAAAAGWSVERRRLVLLHELIHVRRYDWLVQLAAHVACSLYWPDPLAWLARQRLAAAREAACDERVLAAGARPSVYAGHLLAIAESCTAPRTAPLAALAIVQHSQLEGRVMSILSLEKPRRGGAPLAAAAVLALGACALLLATTRLYGESPAAAPAPSASRPAVAGGYGESTFSDDLASGLHLSVRQSGEVELDDSGTAVRRLGPGASLTLETRRGDHRQRLEITPGADGSPIYDFSIDGETRPFDDAARQWATALLDVAADRGAIGALRGQEGALRGQIGAIRGQEGALRGQIGALRGQEGALRGQIGQVRGQAGAVRGQIGALRGQQGALRGQVGALRGQIGALEQQRRHLTSQPGDHARALAVLDEQIAAQEAAIRDLEELLASSAVEAQIAELEQQIDDAGIEARVAEIEAQIAGLDTDGRVAEVKAQIAELDTDGRIAEVEAQIAELDADGRIAEIEARLVGKERRLDEAVARLAR